VYKRQLLRNVQRADALSGQRGNSNLQASVAAGFESAGQNAGPGGLIGMGMAAGGTGIGALQQPTAVPAQVPGPQDPPAKEPAEDPVAKLTQMKQMLDAGLITQDDYDAAKAKLLGL
jgi:membrane protease subunit (stomatin/prohibitin family)